MKRKAFTTLLHPALLILTLTSFLLPACGPEPTNEVQTQVVEKTITPLSTTSIQINGAGATFPLPIYI